MSEHSVTPDETVSRARYLRERKAREEAERLLEVKSREVFEANRRLETEARRLDAAVAARTADLETALAKAEAGERAKAQFLANMSHEIRTPLNGVVGMAQALMLEDLTPAQREKIDIIVSSGHSLTALLNDVLDISKIDAGKIEIAPVVGDVLDLLHHTHQLFEIEAAEKGIQLRLWHEPGIPRALLFDPVRVRQCLDNLVANAIKFTSRGSVEMLVGAARRGTDWCVRIDVRDTGIGISEETQQRLFQAFTQADSETTRRFGGTGLGLTISRQLARLMGGDISLQSEEGRGSTFTFTFAASPAQDEATPSHMAGRVAETPGERGATPLRGMRILLVDDNAVNRQIIRLFLVPCEVEIVEATNGREALDLLAAHEFDIVLLDVHMPVMDGCEAIRLIRASGQNWSALPVIALTADAMIGDREKYLALGMSDYMSKPVDRRELLASLTRYLAPTPALACAS